MNVLFRRAVVLSAALAALASSAGAFDDAAFREVRASMAGLKERPPVVVVEPAPETSFAGMRGLFSIGRLPDAAALKLNGLWTCYSAQENGKNSFDQQTFVQFGGKFMSRGTPEPTQALEFRSNAGSIYTWFHTGKGIGFTAVAAYRALADGRLVRELSLAYSVWPGAWPAGVRHVEALALTEREFGSTGPTNAHSTVYAYALCEPAAKP